jgi:UDP-N-acetylmuramyl pentapeptide phosphotransferase/UDP-N-acetylglucosamine-1-phosphate transferase
MPNSSVSLVTAIITAVVVFLFATAWVTAKAARNTVRAAKAAVPAARKVFWSTIGGVFKLGLFAAILAIALIAWTARDVQKADQQTPTPAPSATRR